MTVIASFRILRFCRSPNFSSLTSAKRDYLIASMARTISLTKSKTGGDELDDGLELDPNMLASSDAEGEAEDGDYDEGSEEAEVEDDDTEKPVLSKRSLDQDESRYDQSHKRKLDLVRELGEVEAKIEKRRKKKQKERERKAKVSSSVFYNLGFQLNLQL